MKMYKYQGRKISVTEGANLAGISPKTMYARLAKCNDDMELAVLGGNNKPLKVPEHTMEQAEKQIMAVLTPEKTETASSAPPVAAEPKPERPEISRMEAPSNGLAGLNKLIEALGSVELIEFDSEALRGELVERRDELTAMRARMYGHMVDWGRVADEAAKQNA